jgi:type IV pilus assembly protein PilW
MIARDMNPAAKRVWPGSRHAQGKSRLKPLPQYLFSCLVDKEKGLSVVELMIALVVGLVLTGGVITIFLSTKSGYKVEEAVSRIQENGRFSLNFMRKTVRMAGFLGCSHDFAPKNHLDVGNSLPLVYDFSKAIRGFDASGTAVGGSDTFTSATPAPADSATDWSPNVESSIFDAIQAHAIAGSDILVIHELSPQTIDLVDPFQNSAGVFIPSADAANVPIGSLSVVSDCQKASVFQVTNSNVHSGRVVHTKAGTVSPGNSDSVWTETYTRGAQLSPGLIFVYYLGQGADKGPSLFQASLDGTGKLIEQELVPGVENMQLLYGLDTDHDDIANKYVSASAVATGDHWDNVVSVRVALLVRSDNAVVPAQTEVRTYRLNGTTITPPNDRRLRRVFTETISIRNRLP